MHSAGLSNSKFSYELSSFKKAVMNNNKESIEKYLSQLKNLREQYLNQALFICIQNFNIEEQSDECLFLLLRYKANPNYQINQQTPLVAACKIAQKLIIRHLVEFGARIQFNGKGQHPLQIILKARREHKQISEFLLSNSNIANIEMCQTYPILLAIKNQFVNIFKQLIDKGANLSYKDENVLHRIMKKKFKSIKLKNKFLKELSGRYTLSQNKDKWGKLPIYYENEEQIKTYYNEIFKPKIKLQKEIKMKEIIKQQIKQIEVKKKCRDEEISFQEEEEQNDEIIIEDHRKIIETIEEDEEDEKKQDQKKDDEKDRKKYKNHLNIQKQSIKNNQQNKTKKNEIIRKKNPQLTITKNKSYISIKKKIEFDEDKKFQERKESKKKIEKKLSKSFTMGTISNDKKNIGKSIQQRKNNQIKILKQVEQIKEIFKQNYECIEGETKDLIEDLNTQKKQQTIQSNETQKQEKQGINKIIKNTKKQQQQKNRILFQKQQNQLIYFQKLHQQLNNNQQINVLHQNLHQEILILLTSDIELLTSQIKLLVSKKNKLIQNIILFLENLILKCLSQHYDQIPNLKIYKYGSRQTGLAINQSDIDLVIVLEQSISNDLMNWLKIEQTFIHQYIIESKFLETASMPVIKLLLGSYFENLNVDITFQMRGHTGLRCKQLISQFLLVENLLQPLVLVLKTLIYTYKLNDTYTGGLGSYSLTLMVIALLQFTVTPKQPSKLGQLLLQFLLFYGFQLDYICQAIIVYPPGFYQKPIYSLYQLPNTMDKTPKLVIYDPLNPVNNVCRPTFRILCLKKLFKMAYLRLVEHKDKLQDIIDGKYAQILSEDY